MRSPSFQLLWRVVGLGMLVLVAVCLAMPHKTPRRSAAGPAARAVQPEADVSAPHTGSVTASITNLVASSGRFRYTVTIKNTQPQNRLIWKNSIRLALVAAKVIMPDATAEFVGAGDPCVQGEQFPPIRDDLVEVPAGGSITCELDMSLLLNPLISAYVIKQKRIRVEVSGSIVDRPARLTFPLEFAGEIAFSRM